MLSSFRGLERLIDFSIAQLFYQSRGRLASPAPSAARACGQMETGDPQSPGWLLSAVPFCHPERAAARRRIAMRTPKWTGIAPGKARCHGDLIP